MTDPVLQKALQDADQGRLEAALTAVRLLTVRSPRRADALEVLGILSIRAGRAQQALHHFTRAVALEPRKSLLRVNFGNSLLQVGRPEEAVAEFRQALEIDPADQPAWQGLLLSLSTSAQHAAWLEAAEAALARWPGWRQVAQRYFFALRDSHRIDQALGFTEAWLERHPDDAAVLSCRAHLGNYRTQSLTAALATHRAYGTALRAELRPPSPLAEPERPLRLGILSGDLRTHSVGFFVEPLLAQCPPDFAPIVFSTLAPKPGDAMAARFRRLLPEWHEVEKLHDAALDESIRAQRIDVLLELSGHTGGNRLGALRHKPVPIILHALGYPNTTGHPAFDARLVDAHTDPPGSEAACTEALLRLDPCFLCYQPPAEAPEPRFPDEAGPLVFGSFNNIDKLAPETIELWSGLLHAVPAARLRLKSEGLSEPAHAEALAASFAAQGIARERLDLLGFAGGLAAHLALYGGVHVALDPLPYNGTTTTCEALWMGVPVVTLAGDRHASRVGVSLLHAVGHPEFVAQNADDYRRIAIDSIQDLAALRELRTSLRPALQRSPLLDAPAYAQRFYAALRQLWREWCAAQAPGSLD